MQPSKWQSIYPYFKPDNFHMLKKHKSKMSFNFEVNNYFLNCITNSWRTIKFISWKVKGCLFLIFVIHFISSIAKCHRTMFFMRQQKPCKRTLTSCLAVGKPIKGFKSVLWCAVYHYFCRWLDNLKLSLVWTICIYWRRTTVWENVFIYNQYIRTPRLLPNRL